MLAFCHAPWPYEQPPISPRLRASAVIEARYDTLAAAASDTLCCCHATPPRCPRRLRHMLTPPKICCQRCVPPFDYFHGAAMRAMRFRGHCHAFAFARFIAADAAY
jgi:hypothetical protein